MTRVAARVAAVVVAMAALVMSAASPALAHAVRVGVDPSNWKSTVTGVQPRVAGVAVSLGDSAQRVTVAVTSRATVVVSGYAGEPFVKVTRGGAWLNQRSSTTWAVAGPTAPRPADIDDHARPRWKRVSDTGAWRWHDSRTHWPGYSPPPEVQQHPGRRQLVAAWMIPAAIDGRQGLVTGRLDWIPGPDATPGALVIVVPLLVLVMVGVIRPWRLAAATALVALTAADVAHAAGMVSGRVGSTWTRLAALPAHGIVSVVLWGAMLVCAVGMLRRRHLTAAVYAAAMFASIVFLADAVPSVALVWRSQAITGLPVAVDRYLVAALTGSSLGLLVAAILLIRRLDRRPPAPQPLVPAATA